MEPARQDASGSARAGLRRAGDVELFVVERGSGMPIVLVHGFPLDHSMWDAQLDPLAEQWRVIAPDLRGFGNSSVTSGTVTMEQMADDLAALLDALDVREPVVLVGLSMGGYVAFQFWRKYAARLRALVLCDTRAIADTPEGAEGRHKLAQRVLTEGTVVAADAMLPKLFGPQTPARDPQAIPAVRQSILRNPPEGMAAALRGMAARPNVTAQLPQIALPTLVLVGQDDAISTVDEMRGIAQAIAGSEFVVIPRSGHMTPVENPAAFNEAIEQFLTRVERGAAAS
ncbi:MAG: alpha/beta fold hydrolase [Pirellulales bacterium]